MNIGDKDFSINGFWETKEEAIYTTNQIEKLIVQKKVDLSNKLLFYLEYQHIQDHLKSSLIAIGLPYKIIGGLKLL